MLESTVLKIKRQESPFYSFLYHLAKRYYAFSFPSIRGVHLPLYYFDYFVNSAVSRLVNVLWDIPLFRARCTEVGEGLSLPDGIPLVTGHHLRIYLGDHVTIGRSTIGASKVFDRPVLRIGNHCAIGYGTVISVAREIRIGDNCMFGPHCIIMDNDDHPVSPARRLSREGVTKEEVAPVIIGNNVWVGSYCAILKGVHIADNSIIATHSVITKDVKPNCIYAGYPARPTATDIDKI